MKKINILLISAFLLCSLQTMAEDGYRLWMRYDKITDVSLLNEYKALIKNIYAAPTSPILLSATDELTMGISGLFGNAIPITNSFQNNCLLIGTPTSSSLIASMNLSALQSINNEGYIIQTMIRDGKKCIVIAGKTDVGVLYGCFYFLQLLQTHQSINQLHYSSSPKIMLRLLNHWDNLNRTVERGYAGFSIFKWHLLPGYIDPRYKDYARANASLGINGTVVSNVNANVLMLTKDYLVKVAALANVFRAYGIKIYLSAKFSAPIEIGKLKTADPFDPLVKEWWRKKVDEIYSYIPDFGGFVVKANSEGQPGPQNYQRTHADGANMIAEALAPHNGILMWRAFVYSNETPIDRTKQAYNEFKSLDGAFNKNVIVQVKNGPLDFQPREPFHPLFGAMPKTPEMMEFQITQEYLGQGTHLVYEAPMMKEVLDADTYANGKGTSVASIIDGSSSNYKITGMAGVSNIGDDRNWCGHPFAQANWFAFGRLAWNPDLSADKIAEDWISMTFTNTPSTLSSIKKIMLDSREILVHYMTPLGLHHIMGDGHHYGPSPWSDKLGRADWNPVYYHRADSLGVGFNRTVTGSNALEQYAPAVRKIYENPETCPDEYLLWFHHISWNAKMKSGKSLWEELCSKYYQGVTEVRNMQNTWQQLKGTIDEERFNHVSMLLAQQEKEAVWWRNACLLYFSSFSKKSIPVQYEQPDHNLTYYQSLKFQFVPGSSNGGN